MHNAHVHEKYVVLNKRSGVTPLHELTELKRTRPELRQTPLTYAGRLDPMASGKLLVLVGDECKKRSLYDGLDKEYEFELLLGVKSDTGDILGLASATGVHVDVSEDALTAALRSSVGVRVFPYPPFSSKTVQGKPLFEHALEGSLGDIEIPQIRSIIYKTELRGVRTVRGDVLLGEVVSRLSVLKESENTGTVHPDFRIGAVQASWKRSIEADRDYVIVRASAIVSTGTYIRTLAPYIAEKVGNVGLAYSIHRTVIGRYQSLPFGRGFWWKQYE